MRLFLTILACAVMTGLWISSAAGQKNAITLRCDPARALAWQHTCWSYADGGGPFALHLRDLGVLDRFAVRHPKIAARFSHGYWPPSRSSFLAAVRELLPEPAVDVVVCIANRESGWRFDAVSATSDYGFMQLNRAAHYDRLIPGRWFDNGQVFDSWVQAKATARLSHGGTRWWPWAGGRWPCF